MSKVWKFIKKRISVTDYSLFALAVLSLGYYSFAEPNIKLFEGNHALIDVKYSPLIDSNRFAMLYSYKLKFKNHWIKAGHVSKIEAIVEGLDTSDIKIYNCWINNRAIGFLQAREIQVDVIISAGNHNVFLDSTRFFKLSFYDNFEHPIKFNRSSHKAFVKLRFYSANIKEVFEQKKGKGSYVY